jgi:hypothetical protein
MGAPRDYLEKLPLPALTHLVSVLHVYILSKQESELIKSEMERVANGERLEAIDQSRYLSVDEPENAGDLKAWQASIDLANVNFQYAENR